MASASQRHSKRHQLQALNPLHRHPAATAPATAPAPSSSLLRADRRGVSKARSGSRGESIVDSSSASDLVDVRDDSPLMDDARVGKGEATMQGMAQMLADRKAEDECETPTRPWSLRSAAGY